MATASRKLMDEIVTARVDKDLKARLIKLARKNKRSPGTEARVAIRNHVDAAK
jgi:predicted transcriptional regulator